MARKTTRARKSGRASTPKAPSTDLEDMTLEDLVKAVMEPASEAKRPHELQVRVGAFYPAPSYQVLIKPWGRESVWASAVGPDPAQAIREALEIQFLRDRGEEAEDRGNFYYQDRDKARNRATQLFEGSPLVRAIKVELEPSRGWVIVANVNPGTPAADLAFLQGEAEVRFLDAPSDKGPKTSTEDAGGKTRPSRRKGRKGRRAHTSAEEPLETGSGSDLDNAPKKDLEAEYKRRHGKFPDRNIKKADLLVMLKEGRA